MVIILQSKLALQKRKRAGKREHIRKEIALNSILVIKWKRIKWQESGFFYTVSIQNNNIHKLCVLIIHTFSCFLLFIVDESRHHNCQRLINANEFIQVTGCVEPNSRLDSLRRVSSPKLCCKKSRKICEIAFKHGSVSPKLNERKAVTPSNSEHPVHAQQWTSTKTSCSSARVQAHETWIFYKNYETKDVKWKKKLMAIGRHP